MGFALNWPKLWYSMILCALFWQINVVGEFCLNSCRMMRIKADRRSDSCRWPVGILLFLRYILLQKVAISECEVIVLMLRRKYWTSIISRGEQFFGRMPIRREESCRFSAVRRLRHRRDRWILRWWDGCSNGLLLSSKKSETTITVLCVLYLPLFVKNMTGRTETVCFSPKNCRFTTPLTPRSYFFIPRRSSHIPPLPPLTPQLIDTVARSPRV